MTWYQVGNDIVVGESESYHWANLDISGDGSIVAISENLDNFSGVKVYQNIDGSFEQIGNGIEIDKFFNNQYATVSISDDGTRLAIGNPYNGNDNNGEIVVYEYENDGHKQP